MLRILRLHLLAAVGLWICHGPASAQLTPADYFTVTPIREAGSGRQELGYAKSKINATSFKQQSLITVAASGGGSYQFVSYYGADKKLVVGRRKKSETGWSDWYLRRTAFTSFNINDSHNVSSIAVDGDGVVHLSWGMHNNPLLYTRSAGPATNDEPFTMLGDTDGNSATLGKEITSSKSVTYPLFYTIPGSGDVLLSYRSGHSGDGDLQLVRWNDADDAWVAVHQEPAVPWVDGDNPDDALPSVNAYTNYAAFDSKGHWHLTWTWRTGGDSKLFRDYQSNHNIMYARSPNDGVDWYRQDGSLYQRNGEHAIDESNSPSVRDLPEGSSLHNQTHMATGPGGKVYVATWWAPRASEGDHLRQYMLAWKDGSQWRASQITDRKPEYTDASGVSQRVPETQLRNYRMTRPVVAVDGEDRVIVMFTDDQRGGKLTLAYSKRDDRQDWQLFDLPTEDMGSWEPTLDWNRWIADGMVSMFYQVLDVGQDASPVAVMEWDARAYFDDQPLTEEPRSGGK